MKLAFNNEAHYTDFTEGYELYKKRAIFGKVLSEKEYRRVIKRYCRKLAEELYESGIIDLPNELGSIVAANITRRPQYRGDKFIGYGKIDWSKGHFDGTLKAFGLVFLPKHNKVGNLRCFGFVANRQLFKKMRDRNNDFDKGWEPIGFKEEMI